MKTLKRKSLPVEIVNNKITYVLLGPIERYAINAENNGVSVIKVVISNDIRPKDVKEAMYHGLIHPDRCGQIISELKVKEIAKTYFYFDKAYQSNLKDFRI